MANVPVVKHDATTNTHTPLTTGDTLAAAYVEISQTVGNQLTASPDGLFVPPAASFAVNTDDSDTVTITGDGSAGNPLTADVVVDADPANQLTASPDGLLVAPPAATTAPTTTTDPALPTTLYGARTALLGAPAGWIEIGAGRKVPYWS